ISQESESDVPTSDELTQATAAPAAGGVPAPHGPQSEVHNLIGLSNPDLFRVADYSVLLLCSYVAIITLVTPSTPLYQFLFILHATLWRLWFTVGLGVILHRQSKNKIWTRHFLKYGESSGEAWSQWKSLYHISTIMCYASL